MDPSDLNHLTKFAVLVVVALEKKNRHISKDDRAASRANVQPISEYFSVRMQIILI